ncbi:MAG: hypothetical protein MK101_09750, partial [Phycisphaerales bacterium]|nr:hypothetical protein [Phycisphaerales bacterium]
GGSRGADLAPGGHDVARLLIASSGLLEFDRIYGRGSDAVHLRTRLDWTIKDGKMVVGSNDELRKGRLSKAITLPVGSGTKRVTPPSRTLPATLTFEVSENQLVLDGRTYRRVRP